MTGTPTYRAWRHMHTRCENPNSDDFKDYGARGIKVCERWFSFEAFLADVGLKPKGMSLDRIDVNGNYEPGNVRWATIFEQANNKRTNVILSHDGRSMSITEWCRELNLNYHSINTRYQRGERPPRLFRPIGTDRSPRPRGLIYKRRHPATIIGAA